MKVRRDPAVVLTLLVVLASIAGCTSQTENDAMLTQPPSTAAEARNGSHFRVEVWVGKLDEGETRVNLTFLDNATARPYGSFFFNVTSNETLQKRAEFWIDRPAWMDLVLNASEEADGRLYRMDVPKSASSSNEPVEGGPPPWFYRVWVLVQGDGVISRGGALCPQPGVEVCGEQPFPPPWGRDNTTQGASTE